MIIESLDNQKFKFWMKLKIKKHRDANNLFLVYGDKLIKEALDLGIVEELITTSDIKEGIRISEKLMKELSVTETIYDSVAVVKKISNPIISNRILVLDDVQNPDNLGALIRSAVAFNFTHIVVSNKSADVYNEKTIRSSGGALFHAFIERKNIVEFISDKKTEGYISLGADAHETTSSQDNYEKIILVMGNEGNGLNSDTKNVLDGLVTIKTSTVESLNVAIAGSILMYEWSK